MLINLHNFLANTNAMTLSSHFDNKLHANIASTTIWDPLTLPILMKKTLWLSSPKLCAIHFKPSNLWLCFADVSCTSPTLLLYNAHLVVVRYSILMVARLLIMSYILHTITCTTAFLVSSLMIVPIPTSYSPTLKSMLMPPIPIWYCLFDPFLKHTLLWSFLDTVCSL